MQPITRLPYTDDLKAQASALAESIGRAKAAPSVGHVRQGLVQLGGRCACRPSVQFS